MSVNTNKCIKNTLTQNELFLSMAFEYGYDFRMLTVKSSVNFYFFFSYKVINPIFPHAKYNLNIPPLQQFIVVSKLVI